MPSDHRCALKFQRRGCSHTDRVRLACPFGRFTSPAMWFGLGSRMSQIGKETKIPTGDSVPSVSFGIVCGISCWNFEKPNRFAFSAAPPPPWDGCEARLATTCPLNPSRPDPSDLPPHLPHGPHQQPRIPHNRAAHSLPQQTPTPQTTLG